MTDCLLTKRAGFQSPQRQGFFSSPSPLYRPCSAHSVISIEYGGTFLRVKMATIRMLGSVLPLPFTPSLCDASAQRQLCLYLSRCNLMGRVLNTMMRLPASVTHLCGTEAHCFAVFGLCENRQIGAKWSDSRHARITRNWSSLIQSYYIQ
jgi:hypothetical protein